MKVIRNITMKLSEHARCNIAIETDERAHLDRAERDLLEEELRSLADTVGQMSAPPPDPRIHVVADPLAKRACAEAGVVDDDGANPMHAIGYGRVDD